MCECITTLESQERFRGMTLDTNINSTRVGIRLFKFGAGTRGKSAAVILADFCPFCGERYTERQEVRGG